MLNRWIGIGLVVAIIVWAAISSYVLVVNDPKGHLLIEVETHRAVGQHHYNFATADVRTLKISDLICEAELGEDAVISIVLYQITEYRDTIVLSAFLYDYTTATTQGWRQLRGDLSWPTGKDSVKTISLASAKPFSHELEVKIFQDEKKRNQHLDYKKGYWKNDAVEFSCKTPEEHFNWSDPRPGSK